MPETVQSRFRPAEAGEIWDIHAWRNAPRVRQAMLTSHEIGREEHEAWFTRKLDDPGFRQMITEQGGARVAVQAYFDIRPGQSAWWAFYFTPAVPDDMAAMMRIWKWVELTGIAYAFEVMDLPQLYCEVLRSNGGVLNWHKRFGFQTCDPSVSTNTSRYDLKVLMLDRAGYDRLRAGRIGADLAQIDLVTHRFDLPQARNAPG
jgi:UDP-4-amino-4,6-dideoxy-N-acetyl-beta-L-altrosamine N-acetyltransferase